LLLFFCIVFLVIMLCDTPEAECGLPPYFNISKFNNHEN
jgi:hypothetical protein